MQEIKVIKCLSCGSPHVEGVGERIGKCASCGSTMLLPRDNEEITALLNTAYIYRENYNYDLAIKTYQFVLEKDSNEISAYEGILLSRYGIEYVKDSYTGKLVPTCHRAHFKSVYEDEYYKTLIEIASEEQRQVVEQKAKDIDKLQKAIDRQLKNESSYDVFISYKATDGNGNKTEDSVIAREIYEELTKKNYRVFFAEKSLEDRLGTEYEPIIFKALHTSKLFILVGTSKENVESNWVRNEWSRFIDRIKNNEDLSRGCFIPVFKYMNPYDMPKVNNSFVQSVDAGKIGYLVTLVDGVTKLLKPEKEQKVLETFDDIDNYVEFEKIRKTKRKELRQKRYNDLKNRKDAKKIMYLIFLYSPYLLGVFSLIMSCLFNSQFINEPAFLINMISWIITVIMFTITLCVHIPKYGCRPFVNIVFPALIILISSLLYNIILTPITTAGYRRDFWSSSYCEDGVVFSRHDDDSEGIIGLIEGKYEKCIKVIDGKRTLILPETGRSRKVESITICVPEGIDALVLPKGFGGSNDGDFGGYFSISVKGSDLKEVYVYKFVIAHDKISVHNQNKQYENYTVYYNNELPPGSGYNSGETIYGVTYIHRNASFYN